MAGVPSRSQFPALKPARGHVCFPGHHARPGLTTGRQCLSGTTGHFTEFRADLPVGGEGHYLRRDITRGWGSRAGGKGPGRALRVPALQQPRGLNRAEPRPSAGQVSVAGAQSPRVCQTIISFLCEKTNGEITLNQYFTDCQLSAVSALTVSAARLTSAPESRCWTTETRERKDRVNTRPLKSSCFDPHRQERLNQTARHPPAICSLNRRPGAQCLPGAGGGRSADVVPRRAEDGSECVLNVRHQR